MRSLKQLLSQLGSKPWADDSSVVCAQAPLLDMHKEGQLEERTALPSDILLLLVPCLFDQGWARSAQQPALSSSSSRPVWV